MAALTANPGCARRALMDAAGADKAEIAAQAGFPQPASQSPFAIARGAVFEAQVKATGGADLIRLLRGTLGLALPEVAYDDLETVGGNTSPEVRYQRTRALLLRAARHPGDAGTLFDHPMLRLRVGGHLAYLEPDLIAFQAGGRFHVVEIKSFAVIDGQADEESVAAAAMQAAVYVLALRDLLTAEDVPAVRGVRQRHPGHPGELLHASPPPPCSTCASRSASCAASWPGWPASARCSTRCRPASPST